LLTDEYGLFSAIMSPAHDRHRQYMACLSLPCAIYELCHRDVF
jgi:hypothetical protein